MWGFDLFHPQNLLYKHWHFLKTWKIIDRISNQTAISISDPNQRKNIVKMLVKCFDVKTSKFIQKKNIFSLLLKKIICAIIQNFPIN